MNRVTRLDLTLPAYPWRDVPMPGANASFALTRLDSRAGTFVLHGRFPPGFARPVAGGYRVTEEFLVLAGRLTIGAATFRPGDLTYVPAGYVRSGMRTAGGCTVLAWFGGPADFLPVDDLPEPVTTGLRTVPVGTDLDLPAARWTRGDRAAPDARGDAVSADLSAWRRLSGGPPAPDDAVRVEKP